MPFTEFIPTPDSDAYTARLHPAGGATSAADWISIAEVARTHGDGNVYLGYHSTIEIRGVTDTSSFEQAIAHTSLGISNCALVASPLSAPARQLAQRLSEALSDIPVPPHWVVGVDHGEGDVLGLRPTAGLYLDGNQARVISAGEVGEVTTDIDTALETLRHNVERASSQADNGQEELRHSAETPAQPPAQLPIGWLASHTEEGRVDLGAGLHQGIIPADIAEIMGRMEVDITVTPWRGVILHDIADGDAEVVLRILAPRGLIFDVNSPLL